MPQTGSISASSTVCCGAWLPQECSVCLACVSCALIYILNQRSSTIIRYIVLPESLCPFNFSQSERTVASFGFEQHSVARLDVVEHRRILDTKHHRHRWHVERFDFGMTQSDLARVFVNFA